jgi:predicted secreted Zn-dependent protease
MRLLVVCLVGSAACVPARLAVRTVPPDAPLPDVTQDVVTYDVTGTTSSELRAQMDALGPQGEGGARNDAYTKWFVRWSYDYDRSVEGQCTLANVRASVEVKLTMPRWTNEAGTLSARWQQYQSALRTHENGHVQNAIDAARLIIADLRQLAPAPDCDTAARLADARATAELERARARDTEYDSSTRHGATQGATFR